MKKFFENFAEGQIITCPHCKGENLHIEKAYLLTGEDSYQGHGVALESSGKIVPIHDAGSDARLREPSFAAIMLCEMCPGKSELNVVFHKGSTYFNISRLPEKSDDPKERFDASEIEVKQETMNRNELEKLIEQDLML